MRSATCQSPCRICNVKSVQLGNIPAVDLAKQTVHEVAWSYRTEATFVDTVFEVQRNYAQGKMEFYETKLKQNGLMFHPVRPLIYKTNLILFKSPLWRLDAIDLFQQSPYCILHNEFLGLLPLHIDCTLATMESTAIYALNARIQNFPNFSDLTRLSADIVERKGWEGKSYMAFYRMALIIFRGLLPENQMDCW